MAESSRSIRPNSSHLSVRYWEKRTSCYRLRSMPFSRANWNDAGSGMAHSPLRQVRKLQVSGTNVARFQKNKTSRWGIRFGGSNAKRPPNRGPFSVWLPDADSNPIRPQCMTVHWGRCELIFSAKYTNASDPSVGSSPRGSIRKKAPE